MGHLLLRSLLITALLAPVATPAGTVAVAEIHGPISPASAGYFLRALDQAREAQAALLVLKLDTPGGLDTSMRKIIQGILASPVPVATFVAPSGARAASAGTYILYASHLAVMAPGTNLGAATPVAIGIGSGPGPTATRKKPDQAAKNDGASSGKSAEERKAMQDAAAYIRSLAQLRGRNPAWAERAVREAASLSADEALKQNVIDFIADDVDDLLKRADGRRVKLPDGEHTLALAGATTVTVSPNWQEQLLAVIADPNIALILMMLGVYGLLFEFYAPHGISGIIGGISLLLACYGLAMLPINLAGALLILLGIALMAAEAYMPSFGAFGIGGIAAFVAGALLLVNTDVPGLKVSLAFIAPLAVVSALVVATTGAFALRAWRRPVVTGVEAMIGETAEALEDFEREGWVRACGERWHARSTMPLMRGAHARIAAVEGLTLVLRPAAPDSAPVTPKK